MILVLLAAVLLFPTGASATTYWVSTSGGAGSCGAASGDSDPGSYLTFAQVDSSNCAGSGDTVMAKAGTYTGSATKLNLLFTAQGTALAPNKVLCEGNRTCILAWNSISSQIVTIENSSHFTFGQDGHGFKIDCANGGTNCGAVALRISSGQGVKTNIRVEGNWLTGCHSSCYNMTERQPIDYFTGLYFGKNLVDPVTDQVSSESQHPVYLAARQSIIEYNTVRNVSRFAIHLYHICTDNIVRYNYVETSGNGRAFVCSDTETGLPTNTQVYNNVFKKTGGTADIAIDLGSNSKSMTIVNNVIDGWPTMIRNTAGSTNVTFKNNACVGSCGYTVVAALTCGGTCTTTNPVVTAATHFTDSANGDYSLKSTSSLINSGIDVTGVRSCNGTCDIGAHETFAPTAASIDANFIDITLGMSSNTPPQFVSGTTGWSVACTGGACPSSPIVSGVSLVTGSNSVIRLTISAASWTACDATDSWTWSFNSSTGTVTDSALIGGSLNQRLFTYTSQAVTNSCVSTPPPGPSGLHIHYKLDDGASGTTPTTANDETVNNLDGTLTGGATWTAGKYGSGVNLTADSGQYIAVPYGSGVNPSSQSLTFAIGININVSQISANKSYIGTPLGSNQRLYVTTRNGSWCIGIQSNSDSACNTALAVQAGWTRIFVTLDSATDVATLCVNGITGTGPDAAKSYTSFTAAGDFQIGRIPAVTTGGGGVFDEFKLWTSVESCIEDYEAWEPAAPPATGTYSQVAHQWQEPFKNSGSTTNDYAGLSATVPVSVGGLVSLVTQIDCTIADCQSVGVKLWYSRNGGTEQLVPDNFTSDQVKYAGSVPSDVFVGAATCCLTGALTENHGLTRLTSAAEIFDIGQDASYTRRSVLRFGDTASGTYCFKEHDQNGLELSGTYTPSAGACVVIEDQSAGSGF